MADPDHKDTTDTGHSHDVIDVEPAQSDASDASDAPENGSASPQKSSGGGFVWLLAVVIVIAGAGYAAWPYIGHYADPYVKDVRAALGLEARPTQPRLPGSDAPVERPTPALPGDALPSAPDTPEVAAPAPEPEPEPESASAPEMPTQLPSMPESDPVPDAASAPAPAPQTSAAEPQSQPAQPDLSPIVESLSTRIDVLEAQLNAALQAGGGDGEAARTALDATGHLARTLDELKAQLATLNTRLNALEQRPSGRVDPTASSQALVLAVTQLQSRALSGAAFETELDALEAVAANRPDIAGAIAGLRAHAGGIAEFADLKSGFGDVAGRVMRTHGESGEAGWWNEIKDTVGGLVTVRRTDPEAIDDPVERALAIAEGALAENDLKTAVVALSDLSGPEAQAARDWMDAAQARVRVVDTVDGLHAAALSALSQTGAR